MDCKKCGNPIPYQGKGRPREYCDNCKKRPVAAKPKVKEPPVVLEPKTIEIKEPLRFVRYRINCPRCHKLAKVVWVSDPPLYILEAKCNHCHLHMWTESNGKNTRIEKVVI
jgi:hypothetical protein